jgi:hypothetical protein
MNKKGFAALIVVILIAATLSLGILTQNYISYSALHSISLSQAKEQSYYAAHSCLEIADYKIGEKPTYTGDEKITVGSYTCTILPVVRTGAHLLIQAKALVQQSEITLSRSILLPS